METSLACILEREEKNKFKGLAKLFVKTDDEMALITFIQQHIDLAFKRGYDIGRSHSIHNVVTFHVK